MKKQMTHLLSVLPLSPRAEYHKLHLLQQHNDLSLLIHRMEHDKNLNPPRWQIESLKRTLKDIESQIHFYQTHKMKKS